MSNQLPVARLRPRGGADQLAIARGHARTGARAAGRFALFATRAVATIAVCGAGLYMVGAGMRPHSSYDDLNRRLDQMRQMNESTLRMLQEPRIDFSTYPEIDRARLARPIHLSADRVQLTPQLDRLVRPHVTRPYSSASLSLPTKDPVAPPSAREANCATPVPAVP
jgi:hypothetical protein